MERRNFFRTLGLALAGSALIPHEQISRESAWVYDERELMTFGDPVKVRVPVKIEDV